MATAKRQPDTALKNLLFEQFHGLSFFRAVQLIELLDPDRKVGASLSPAQEPVRFGVKPELRFAPSDISAISKGGDDQKIEMQVSFMGLFGPNAPLPHWYTILAAKEKGVAAFLDIFHHRLISLFYLAWRKNSFAARYGDGQGGSCSAYLLSLIGLGTPGLAERVGVLPESLAYFSGLLSRSPCSAKAIEFTAGYFLDADVSVEQLIEKKIAIEPEELTRLGTANCRMGVDAVCGHEAWEGESRFRLRLGPLAYRQFQRLLPSGDLFTPLVSLVRYMTGVEHEFEVRPYLMRDEVPGCVIGKPAPDSPRLGWSTWMKRPGTTLENDPHVTLEVAG
ncbi:hypothetical protein OR1_01686 [Geobacter sp. OR-1]|uniref:type VI secretion system baseplate subunit TssG n=1 Tax=Geobacter sp. OR-1 TaxID=1266765 RepID=UPI000542D623|nr:type VI secretion system baseplate subunit TssG [Geobacter sp. OR-1]GAM09408.1 hypothetical protein OR1_01686 [Geobacter sp. OR-1]